MKSLRAVVVAAALAITACSGDSDSASTTVGASTTGPATTVAASTTAPTTAPGTTVAPTTVLLPTSAPTVPVTTAAPATTATTSTTSTTTTSTTTTTTTPSAPSTTFFPPPTTMGTVCGIDPASPEAVAALADLNSSGDGWQVQDFSDECHRVAWIEVSIGPSGSSPRHLLFFVHGQYVGLATDEPYPYTEVISEDDDEVTVNYRWIEAGEPDCCPIGGPARIRYRWDGREMQQIDPLPPVVTGG